MSEQYQHQTDDDIADRIGQLPPGILDVEDEPGAAPQEQAAPEEQENSPSEPEQPEHAEGQEEEEETEKTDKDEKPASEEEPDKDKPEAEEDDPVYEVILPDGQTEEVPISELARGYLESREVDNIKAETAEQKRLYESRMNEIPHLVQQGLKERQDELAQRIEQWAQANPLGEPPPAHMLDLNSESYNPDRYHYEMRQYEDHRHKMQAAAQELQQIAREREQQQQATRAREHEKLKAAWPEIVSDNAKQAAFFKQVQETYGLGADELRAIEDHRHFLILRDAVGYRNMKAKAPEVRQKVKARPKPVKPGQRKTDKDIQRADYAEQRKRLKRSGRPEDAVDLLMNVEL